MAVHKEDAASIFAQHFATTRYEDIPPSVVEVVKKSILDIIGVSLGATTLAPGCRELVELAREGGGKEESSIIGFGDQVPAWMAAFANGALAHGLDYDDLHPAAVFHASGPIIPAAFAIAERKGRVSGKEFITAIALGHDMGIRMALAVPNWLTAFRWIAFPVMGVFAGAATCGRLLGLDKDRLVDAIGIALCYSAGTLEISHGIGSIMRALYDAFPNKGGVLSALMAQRGIAGPRDSLEGENGFFNAFYRGEYHRDALLGDLGKRFEGAGMGYKAWPSCGNTHTSIDATLKLVKEQNLGPDDIEEITVFYGDTARGNVEPLEGRQKPPTVMDAKFSLPFTLACAAARRKVVLEDFTPEGITNAASLQLARKVVPKYDNHLNQYGGIPPGRIEVRTKRGASYSKQVDFAHGHPQNPMTFDDLIEKFKNCASYAVKPLPPGNIDKTVELVYRLEEVDDVGQIIRLQGG